MNECLPIKVKVFPGNKDGKQTLITGVGNTTWELTSQLVNVVRTIIAQLFLESFIFFASLNSTPIDIYFFLHR